MPEDHLHDAHRRMTIKQLRSQALSLSYRSLLMIISTDERTPFDLFLVLEFLHGDHGESSNFVRIQEALDNGRTDQAEIALCKKNKTPIWLLVHLAPIKNDKNSVVLYLCQFKDITPLKQPLDDENNKGLSRILQIARIAKSKQQFNQIETKDLHKATTSISSNFTQASICYEANGRISITKHSLFIT
ncbi:hypothetical protein DICVIV_08367 [Dictyocaulus viviparus]|uniref:PAC domain-containing protein n=1 Tax=Dictyocaulus viviparus TaxID=29172 RepID=A0A0D8XPB8_DICVI|nr:hypothetical protein DICVIV_08367 [Dictyocaulus viviparus]